MLQNRTPLVCLLTDNETNNSICLRYWSVNDSGKWSESYDELQAAAGLNRRQIANMLRSACRAYFPHLRCNTCGTAIEVGTRSDYSPLTGLPLGPGKRCQPVLCASCDAATLDARREADLHARRQHHERVTEALERIHDQSEPIDYARLTYVQTCFLYATLVASDVGPDERVIPSLDSLASELAATLELSEEIYTRLHADKILVPAQSSAPNMFTLDEESGSVTFDVRKIAWTLALDVTGRSMDEIFSVLFNRLDKPEPEAVEELWYLLAESECEDYFANLCERYRFFQPDIYSPKVAAAVRHYLDRLSIGQVWNVIFYTLKDLAALSQERVYTRQHIYNMIPGSIRRKADHRLANDRSIWPWHRRPWVTESWFSSIMLDKVLKGGDMAFETLKGHDVSAYIRRALAASPAHGSAASPEGTGSIASNVGHMSGAASTPANGQRKSLVNIYDISPPHVEAEVTYFAHVEAGLPSIVTSGHRPLHALTDSHVIAGHHEYLQKEAVMRGETVTAHIWFIPGGVQPHALRVGREIVMLEGKCRVGYARVTKVFSRHVAQET